MISAIIDRLRWGGAAATSGRADARTGLALKRASAANQLVIGERIDPCMSDVFPWEKVAYAHELMRTNPHKPGNMVVLVNAPRTGLKNFDNAIEAASLPELNRQSMRGQ
jgi:hypothetical protein